ncbi:hypothetical protein [Nannocystis pusilla]|uniref:Secreted protein n=1 Tax=Nannocystis pusilla TaxID=889268 RepID=A0ABS7TRD3_9BACT|nr:hypothetical protein [Nannocystis pusilla]MBZ5710783.1 hypothetical protein [Nannocystis pusilla]
MKKAVLFLVGCAVSFVVMVGQSGNAIASVEPISGIEPTAAVDLDVVCSVVIPESAPPPGAHGYTKRYFGGAIPKCKPVGANCRVIVISAGTPDQRNECYVGPE